MNANNVTDNTQAQKIRNTENEFLKVFETGDVSKLDQILAPDFINHTAIGDRKGIDSTKAMVQMFHSRFTNVKMEVLRQWGDKEYVSS